jgi:pimeloyl-ACP methyl ester carboxylesterase
VSTQDKQAVFTRNDILVDDLETSYLEAGSGPPVVLLHGGEFGGEAETCWEHTIPALARHFRVIAPDLLGFGRTAKVIDFIDGRGRRLRHLARFLKVVGAAGAPAIGNSMGGMLLLFDAASNDPLLNPSKLVSIAGGGALYNSEHTNALFDYDGSTEGMQKIIHALFHGDEWPRNGAYVRRRRDSSLAPGAWEAVAAARFRRPPELQEQREPKGIAYERIAIQALIVAGAEDKIKPYGWWEELTGQMANADFALIPQAGHCPQIEQPDLVNKVLLDFLLKDKRPSARQP